MQKTLKIISTIVIFLSLYFIVYNFLKFDYTAHKLHFHFQWIPWIVILSLGYSALNLLLSSNWHDILSFLEKRKLSYKSTFFIYLRTITTKYIPGNIVQFASRHYLGRQFLYKHDNLIISNFLEIIIILISAIGIFLLGVQRGMVFIPNSIHERLKGIFPYAVIGFFLVFFFFLIRWKKKHVSLSIRDLFSRAKDILSLSKVLLFYIFFLVSLGCILHMILTQLLQVTNIPIEFSISAFALSYFASVITFGAPGGLGIRESVLILLFKGMEQGEYALIAAVILRIITIGGDVFSFIFSCFISKEPEA